MYDENNNQLYRFELMSAGGNRQFDINGVIQRKSQEMAMSMLTDFITLGGTGVGSYALSQDKTTIFSDAIGTYCDVFSQSLQQRCCPQAFQAQRDEHQKCRHIRHGDIKAPDLVTLGTFIVAAAQAGMLIPDDKLLDWIRIRMTAPERDKNAPIVPPIPQRVLRALREHLLPPIQLQHQAGQLQNRSQRQEFQDSGNKEDPATPEFQEVRCCKSKMTRIGFTGTQHGMSAYQKVRVRRELRGHITEARHGMCIGSDNLNFTILPKLGRE